MTERQSNLELLRIICILLIISMHILGEIFGTTNLANKGFILLVNSIGNTGITLFLLISGYFGIVFKIRKLLRLATTTCFYSIISYPILTYCFGIEYNWIEKISFLFPYVSSMYWFIAAYIVIYCLSPFLNRLVVTLSRREYELLLLVLGLFFIIAPTCLLIEIQNDLGKGLINLIITYLIGRYIRIYDFPTIIKKYPRKIFWGSIISITVLNAILTGFTGHIILRFARDNSVLILIASLSLLCLFTNRKFISLSVNELATYVFPIYLSHNLLVKSITPYYHSFEDRYTFILIFLSSLILIFFLCIVFEKMHRFLLGNVENRIIDWVIRRIYSCRWIKEQKEDNAERYSIIKDYIK